jgi:hypothetical protein
MACWGGGWGSTGTGSGFALAGVADWGDFCADLLADLDLRDLGLDAISNNYT